MQQIKKTQRPATDEYKGLKQETAMAVLTDTKTGKKTIVKL